MEPKKLQELRDRLNLTQKNLGLLLDVRAQTISRWENGRIKIPGMAAAAFTLIGALDEQNEHSKTPDGMESAIRLVKLLSNCLLKFNISETGMDWMNKKNTEITQTAWSQR